MVATLAETRATQLPGDLAVSFGGVTCELGTCLTLTSRPDEKSRLMNASILKAIGGLAHYLPVVFRALRGDASASGRLRDFAPYNLSGDADAART